MLPRRGQHPGLPTSRCRAAWGRRALALRRAARDEAARHWDFASVRSGWTTGNIGAKPQSRDGARDHTPGGAEHSVRTTLLPPVDMLSVTSNGETWSRRHELNTPSEEDARRASRPP